MASHGLIAIWVLVLISTNETSGHDTQKDIVEYVDCGGTGHIEKITVKPCLTEPCEFTKGTRVHVLITGSFSRDSEHVKLRVSTLINTLNLTLPGVAQEMCGKHVECPVKANELRTADVEVPIYNMYPSMVFNAVILIWIDEDLQFCIQSKYLVKDP